MVRNSLFDPDEIARERRVICEEIKKDRDRPADYVEDVYEALLYGDHPLGRPVLGFEQTVETMPDAALPAYVERLYRPSRLVVGIADRIDFDARAEVERLLGDLVERDGESAAPPAPRAASGVLVEESDSEQAYFCLGVPAYPVGHPNRYVLLLIATVLGTGMSSRLYDEFVSKRALGYFVYAVSGAYADCGSLWVQTGVDVERIEEAIEVVTRELRRLARDAVPADELEKARNVAKGTFAFQAGDAGQN